MDGRRERERERERGRKVERKIERKRETEERVAVDRDRLIVAAVR